MALRAGFLAATLVFSLAGGGTASAQIAPGPSTPPAGSHSNNSEVAVTPGQLGLVSETPSRMRNTRRQMNHGRNNQQNLQDLPTDPARISADVRRALQGAQVACDVTGAEVVGRSGPGDFVYEASCAQGAGYILVASERPQAIDCAMLSNDRGQWDRDNALEVITECRMQANQVNGDMIGGYARQAGLSCGLAQTRTVGRTRSGLVFEALCDTGDGYWISQSAGGWSRSPCLVVSSKGDECTLMAAAEQSSRLARQMGADGGAGCVVQRTEYLGSTATEDFLQASCASGERRVVRLDHDGLIKANMNCAESAGIGAACKP